MTTSHFSSNNHHQLKTSLWIHWFKYLRDQDHLSQLTIIVSVKIPPSKILKWVTSQPMDTQSGSISDHSGRKSLLTLLWRAENFE